MTKKHSLILCDQSIHSPCVQSIHSSIHPVCNLSTHPCVQSIHSPCVQSIHSPCVQSIHSPCVQLIYTKLPFIHIVSNYGIYMFGPHLSKTTDFCDHFSGHLIAVKLLE